MELAEYPNLYAISIGTIAGNFREWPAVRGELNRLIAEVEKLKVDCECHRIQAVDRGNSYQAATAEIAHLRAEGRREAFEAAADIAQGYAMNEDNMVDTVHDGHQHAKYLGLRIAAAIREAAQVTPSDICEWKPWHDESGCFDTACGNVQYFSEGNVADNRYKVCPYCGKNISAKA